MRRRLRALSTSLSVRLFFWIALVLVSVCAIFAFQSFRNTSRLWTQSDQQSAHRTSALIKRSIHYGMLLNRKEDVHRTIRNIAKGPGVEGIRIYNKTGSIIFSADDRELGRRVDMKAEACVSCHEQDRPLRSLPNRSRVRIFRDRKGHEILGLINPIENLPDCSSASCHAHPVGQHILGVLDLKMRIDHISNARRQAWRETLWASLFLALIGGLAAALFIWRVVTRPVRRLTEGTRQISAGELETHLDVQTQDEIGELAESFNRMVDGLRDARQRSRTYSEELERKVEELSRMRAHVLQIEKMASLGKLSATVAHELNNPLGGILVYAKLVARDLREPTLSDEARDECLRHLGIIQRESARCGDIVRDLLTFARQSKVNLAPESLSQVVGRAVQLVQHKAERSGVVLEVRPHEGADQVRCDGAQVQQAVLALLVNGIEAMPSGGRLTVSLTLAAEQVEITITDTGPGIPDDVLPHIFEPFFSTKSDEKGVGLGLAVVYGIAHRHGGRITVDSLPGAGATFRLTLPRSPDVPPSQAPNPATPPSGADGST